MAKTALVVNVRISGVREVLRAFREMPKDASDSLREHTLKLSQLLATKIAAAARADSKQSALMAKTVKARRDRLPAVQAGGSKRVGRNRTPAYGILFGSEFGMNSRSGWYAAARYAGSSGRQFRPHLGRHSYWFFKTVDDNSREIGAAWHAVADDVVRQFGEGV